MKTTDTEYQVEIAAYPTAVHDKHKGWTRQSMWPGGANTTDKAQAEQFATQLRIVGKYVRIVAIAN
jgi:hypothetical protein